MKKFIVFLGALLICGVTAAQEKIDFYKFIESIDWNSTREQFVEKHRDIILPDSVRTSKIFNRGENILIKNICIGDIVSNVAIVGFDTLTTKLKDVSISYFSDFEFNSEYAKRWTTQFDQNLQENLGDSYKTLVSSYYFHANSTIQDAFRAEGMTGKIFFITPPAPRYEKDFRVANWGDSKEKIQDLEGRLNESSDQSLYYFEDRLGDLKCTIVYKFANDKLIWAKYMFKDIDDDMAIYHYKRFEEMLDKKYGVVCLDTTRWEDDKYKEKYEGKEIEAIKQGYRKRLKSWCNGPTEVYLGIIQSDMAKNGWYLVIEYNGREMGKIQEQAVFDAL